MPRRATSRKRSRNYWARSAAALFNRLHPYIIGIVSLTLFPEAPLAADVAAGRFVEAGERERLPARADHRA